MVSQEKALQILDNGDLQDIFLKYSFEEVQKVKLNLSHITPADTCMDYVNNRLINYAEIFYALF